MTRKDYVAIAAAFARCQPVTDSDHNAFSDAARWQGWNMARQNVADALAADNARFDRARFLAACGVAP